jgi:hypothetical protein
MYPNLVAATVLAAQNVVSEASLAGGKDFEELMRAALRQISAGLPPPR